MVGTVLAALGLPVTASGQSDKGQFGITPARREVSAAPPVRLQPITAFNDTRVAFKVRVFPVLLRQVLDGSFAFSETPSDLRAASLILSSMPDSFTIEPGAQRTVQTRWDNFPSGTKAAAVGVIFEGRPVRQVGAVQSISRLLNINLLSLPGRATSSGRFTRLRVAQVAKVLQLVARVKNTGERIDRPTRGEVLIRDGDDKVVFRGRWPGDIVLPGAERDFPIPVAKVLQAGRYVGKATMRFGGTRRARIIAPFTLTGPNELPTEGFVVRGFDAQGYIDQAAKIRGVVDGTGTAPSLTTMRLSMFRVGVGASTTKPVATGAVALKAVPGKQTPFSAELGRLEAGSYRIEGTYRDPAGDQQTVTASLSAVKQRGFFDRHGTLVVVVLAGLLLLAVGAHLVRRHLRLRDQLREATSGAGRVGVIASEVSDAGGVGGAPQPVNVNTATVTQLQELPGVGPRAAARIAEHREEFGRFRSLDDLTRVEGFDAARVAELAERVEF